MEIFGFKISRKDDKETLEVLELDQNDDAAVVEDDGFGSFAGVVDGVDGSQLQRSADEALKIKSYREISVTSEVDEALTEIRNEVFIFDVPGKRAFELQFEEGAEDVVSAPIQKKILAEAEYLYAATDFHNRGIEYFNRWYVDGRLYMQKVIDKHNPARGIKRIQLLDPLNIRKVRLIRRDLHSQVINLNDVEEFYVYSRRFDDSLRFGVTNVVNYGAYTQSGARIRPDAIAYTDSHLRDMTTGRVIGYLDKALVPYNNLKMMEDAMVIFRVVRAPQRRAIYVDVGNLQKNKSDSYMKEVMARFKNRMTYDSKTGLLADRRNVLSMLEDYWLPRREGSKGTEIQNLEGQDSNGTLEEVEYYRDKLWRALGVPRSRFGEQAQSFVFGKGIEVQRDEYRFKKFLNTLRRNFMMWFEECLKTQLVLKRVIKEEEWDDIRRSFFWTYPEDNAFVEYKESEIVNNRVNTLALVDPYVGKYYTVDWVRRNVLRQNDEEMAEMDKQMEKEEKAGLYDKEIEDDGQPPPQQPAIQQPVGQNQGADDGEGEQPPKTKGGNTINVHVG